MEKKLKTKLPKNDLERRRELADFLRTRRERINPASANITAFGRRRTPGLRREEIAELVGVGSSWYTWLEQARDIKPSPELLARLGQVLQLNSSEIKHMFLLAGRKPPEKNATDKEEVPASIQRLIMDTLNVPAYVFGKRFDILLWNKKFSDIFGDLNDIPKENRNWLELVFSERSKKQNQEDWELNARRTLAEFRSSIGDQIGSPEIKTLVARLQKNSPEFAKWWKMHDVQERDVVTYRKIQRDGKTIVFERIFLSPSDANSLQVVIMNPVT